jgi:hypothetical protein
MPPGRTSWIRRSLGRATSWQLLRRSLAAQGTRGRAALATVITSAPAGSSGSMVATRPAGGGKPPFGRLGR